MSRLAAVIVALALSTAPALAAKPGCPTDLEPASDLGWRALYQGGRQAFNLGCPRIAETWLREAARQRRPWPKTVVTVDNFPETYLPYYHLSWSLLEQDRCAEAAGVWEAAVRQGVVLAEPRRHLRLRRRLCDAEGPDRATERAEQALARWSALESGLDSRAREDLRTRYPELYEQVDRARRWQERRDDPVAARMAADLATGAASRLEVVSCWMKDPELLQRCEIHELAKGVVRIDSTTRGAVRRGTGFFVGLGATANVVLTLAHVVIDAESISLRLPSQPDRRVAGELLAIQEDDPNGLAVIRTNGEIPSARCLVLSDSLPAETETVFTIGFPLAVSGAQWTLTQGDVAGPPEGGWLRTNLTVDEGSSGGPLIRNDGRVLGIVAARPAESPEFAFARDVRTLRSILTEWEIPLCENEVYSLPPNR